MREIKFRAWHRGAREMLSNRQQGFEGDVFNWLHEGQPIEIMQFTGLLDKNGKDIYEGDIVEAPHNFGPAGFSTRRFAVHFDEQLGSYQWNYWMMSEAEVIGNVHETPELLEPTK